jgi:hypothetical protein
MSQIMRLQLDMLADDRYLVLVSPTKEVYDLIKKDCSTEVTIKRAEVAKVFMASFFAPF